MSGGRRTAARRSRVNLTLVLAVVLPLLSAAMLLLVRPDATPADATYPPSRTTLTAATLICPAALPGAPAVAVTTVADDVTGQVSVGLGDDATDVDLVSGQVTSADDKAASAVSGVDDAAPGLVAGRSGGDEKAVAGCAPPTASRWFTGVGAGASHRSVLELTNPDSGTAVADITVHGRDGVVDAPALHGVSVRGGTSVRLDLSTSIPRTDDLALEVVTTRGRIGASVLDRYDRVGSDPLTQDWMAGQAEPTADNLLLGIAPGTGTRTLTIANPGDDEVRAELKVIDTESVFAPDGVEPIRVPPQSVVRVPVTAIVNQAVDDGAIGISISASGPVTASMRSLVRKDLSLTAVGASFDTESTVLLPAEPATGSAAADRRVVLSAVSGAGAVTVVARAADGSSLKQVKAEIVPGRGVVVRLPPSSRQLSVLPSRTSLTGAVVTSAKAGASVLPLTVPVSNGLVPQVRPGLS
ncbi:DUF5719 family protein [Nocardioides sp. URHA0020]|uniref:DUF5719 family protein n=1 Tax=Nocardioides sp. URHA0020 TaxID=1380392 RepID=UPI00048E95EC|nr:DUF5719 family protein [Nocardioides sp. URHA0020]